MVIAGIAILSLIAIEPPPKKVGGALAPGEQTEGPADLFASGDEAAPGEAATAQGGPAGESAASSGAQGQQGGKVSTRNLACKAGQNGGATDKGVAGNRIRLAATNVRSGTGSSFLGTAYIGLQAVVNRVNGSGGVCGRLLDLRLVDDGWEAARGATYIANFIKENYFALPVVPSSEGLTQAIENKTISNAGIPVVGSDGMLKEQYQEPWVWPVAAATVTTMRVMAKHAWDSGARTFGIIYDTKYRFGLEGAAAFRQYVKSLTGSDPKADIGITPGQGSYSGDAQRFNEKCGAEGCEFIAFLLTPETASTYISSQTEKDGKKQGFGTKLTGGAQPLFNERFARDCARHCDGMYVWTGYNPPIGRLSSEPDIAAYVNDVKSVDPSVDEFNQFLQGSYLGMKVFVAALQKVGPNLTRAGVRDAMNSLTYTSDLASPLTWGPKVPQQRFANPGAQAFRINQASGSFIGFAETDTGFRRDPTPGVVP